MPENTFGKSVEIPESHPTTLFRIYQHFQQKLDLFRDFSVTMYHTNLHTSIELYITYLQVQYLRIYRLYKYQ